MNRLHPKLILLSILALFFFPLALAWMMFTGAIPFKSENTRNLGQLVLPAVPLDWSGIDGPDGTRLHATLHGRWVILYDVPDPCRKECLELAAGLRQVHLALGHNSGRIKVALLVNASGDNSLNEQLSRIYPDFQLLAGPSPELSGAIRQAGTHSTGPGNHPDVYLVDPDGNIMMTYNGDGSPNKLIKDLDRLLTWSKQDKRS